MVGSGRSPHSVHATIGTDELEVWLEGCRGKLRCRLAGRSHQSYVEAQALVWDTLRQHQDDRLFDLLQGIRLSGAAGLPARWVFLSRRFDETSMHLYLPSAARRLWVDWTARSMRADTFLREADLNVLLQVLAKATHGLVHVFSQRNILRTSAGVRSQVVQPPLLVQRTSASNVRAALDSMAHLSLQAILTDIAPYVEFVLLHVGLDHASGNDRAIREMVADSAAAPNVGILPTFCGGHELGRTSCDAPFIADIITKLYQWCNLQRQAEYTDKWRVSMLLAISAAGIYRTLESAESWPVARARAERHTNLFLGLTLFRAFNIQGSRRRPGESWLAPPAADLPGQALADDLLRYWHIDPSRTHGIHHRCPPFCPCGPDGRGLAAKLSSAFLAVVVYLTPSKSPELGRWTTISETLACICFTILFGRIGPAAWLHAWPLEAANRIALENEGHENQWVRENSVRLRGVAIGGPAWDAVWVGCFGVRCGVGWGGSGSQPS